MERDDINRTGTRAPDAQLERRPGVPAERMPPRPDEGVHWARPDRQTEPAVPLPHDPWKPMTPVFGTAQPPAGLSGRLRRLAYTIPGNKARRWLLLMFADRVDVVESAVGGIVKRRPLAVGVGAAAAITLAVMLKLRA